MNKEPLNSDEIRNAVNVVKRDGGLNETMWFETISLDESEKVGRGAYVCCYERSSGGTFRGIVAGDELVEWGRVEGGQARIGPEEFQMACELARACEGFVEALRRRGIDDVSRVLVESWSMGNFFGAEESERRLGYGHCWLMNDAGDNPYARPIGNLHPVFDLNAREVLRIDDFGVVPIPPDPGPIRQRQPPRRDLREIAITQPDGPSFHVDGYHVKWHNWDMQVGFAQRDGLVLHDIGVYDGGRLRPVIRRASMAEMVVPYGDPRDGEYRRNAFDTGEYGLGVLFDSLELGCDCVGHIHYFDVWTHHWEGEPRLIKNAVCMHEEDYGIQWKFSVPSANQTTVTRSRRLVISSVSTIGNYVYGFFWYFYMDGTLGVEIKATGIPFPSAMEGKVSPYGRQIGDQIESHVHQHVFCFRFDMVVDGEGNSVTEMNFRAAPLGPDNPHANAVITEETLFRTESEAQREIDSRQSRYWRIINPSRLNRFGQPVAYKLVPGANSFPLSHPDSSIGRRAAFMFKHLWVTRRHPDELYPAGWFPNQHPGGDGLPRYTAANRPIENQPLVIWHTINYHHWPRPEDWPVQPVVYATFHLMPDGFFNENPTMDLPHT